MVNSASTGATSANSIALASTYGTLPLGGIVFTVLVGVNTLFSCLFRLDAAHSPGP